jgi:hypothetical protein
MTEEKPTPVMTKEDLVSRTKRTKVIRQNSFLVMLLCFLLLSLTDIFYYIYQNKQFEVDNAVINLESPSSDAQLVLDAELPLTSYLHSYNIHDGHCRMFYSEDISAASQLIGDIFAQVDAGAAEVIAAPPRPPPELELELVLTGSL